VKRKCRDGPGRKRNAGNPEHRRKKKQSARRERRRGKKGNEPSDDKKRALRRPTMKRKGPSGSAGAGRTRPRGRSIISALSAAEERKKNSHKGENFYADRGGLEKKRLCEQGGEDPARTERGESGHCVGLYRSPGKRKKVRPDAQKRMRVRPSPKERGPLRISLTNKERKKFGFLLLRQKRGRGKATSIPGREIVSRGALRHWEGKGKALQRGKERAETFVPLRHTKNSSSPQGL